MKTILEIYLFWVLLKNEDRYFEEDINGYQVLFLNRFVKRYDIITIIYNIEWSSKIYKQDIKLHLKKVDWKLSYNNRWFNIVVKKF